MASFAWSEDGKTIIIRGERLEGELRDEIADRIGPEEDAVVVPQGELEAWLAANPRPKK